MPCPIQDSCAAYPLCYGCPGEYAEPEHVFVPREEHPVAPVVEPQLEPELLEHRRTLIPAAELRVLSNSPLGENRSYSLTVLQQAFVQTFNAWAAEYAEHQHELITHIDDRAGVFVGRTPITTSSPYCRPFVTDFPGSGQVRRNSCSVSSNTRAYDIGIRMGLTRESTVAEFVAWVKAQLLAADYYFRLVVEHNVLMVAVDR